MEKILIEQEEIVTELQKFIKNYKKQPTPKRDYAFYSDRLSRLEEFWRNYDGKDSILRQEYSGLSAGYLNQYEKTRNSYEAIKEEINNKLQELRQPSPLPGLSIESITGTIPKQPRAKSSTPSPQSISPTPDQDDDEKDTKSRNIDVKQPPLAALDVSTMRLIRKQLFVIHNLKRTLETLQLQDVSKAYCAIKIDAINDLWNQMRELNQSIWAQTEELSSFKDYNVSEYYELEDQTQDFLIKLTQKLDELSILTAPASASSQMKLPKITLPQFDGNYLKWKQFHDLFNQMIHKQDIPESQKMWFLKTNLSGEAERLIRHLPISEDNYTAAWNFLKERYNNKRVLTRAVLEKLLGQPSCTADSAASMKRLHDTTRECLMALNNLGVPTDNWDPILLHLLLKKVDKPTHTAYEQGLSKPRELQPVDQFLKFLERRFQSLETLGTQRAEPSLLVRATSHNCKLCQRNHKLFECPLFLHMITPDRVRAVNRLKVCANCLRDNHQLSECTSGGCTRCGQRHNTLLHPQNNNQTGPRQHHQQANDKVNNKNSATSLVAGAQHQALLATAAVTVISSKGRKTTCRALLDSGSQLSFVTERLAKALRLKTTSEPMNIDGIGKTRQKAHTKTSLEVQSRFNGYKAQIQAFILPQIMPMQPAEPINTSQWQIPRNIKLADPNFNEPGEIDLLIGAELYHDLLTIGQIKLGHNMPTVQNTVLGWIIAGKTPKMNQQTVVCGVSTAEEDLDAKLESFWQLEEAQSTAPKLTAEQARDPSQLGESKDIAFQRFLSLERKLNKNPEIAEQYKAFMAEYLRLHHMSQADSNWLNKPHYFLPHHSVTKPDSTTTKLRVVFDGSSKTTSKVSLNDLLATGPTVQDELLTILLRFRLPRFVFTADIEKMYRQILVDPADRNYQLIWWRDSTAESIKCYSLNTVTYGTTSAPFLATRCLQHLARCSKQRYPLGAEIIERDFYVDDLMTGANTLSEALEIQKQVQTVLNKGGFKLRKWCANHKTMLQSIAAEDKAVNLEITDSQESIKTLGLLWNPMSDEFCIKSSPSQSDRITKRTVLSDIAHLFDPLGLISPVVVLAKIFMQRLWRLKLDWDASLPMELHSYWLNFRAQITILSELRVQRHMFAGAVPQQVQLHAFADASERAYGAAIYLRSINRDKVIIVRLLCSKSRVAPVKPCTLPRLELCAAKLSAELVSRVKSNLRLDDVQCYYWTDSEITLAWINADPALYHTFIGNRITTIQELSPKEQWRHVKSQHNPADMVSRGVHPESLPTQDMWFYGPMFLHSPEVNWPPKFTKLDTNAEKWKSAVTLTASVKEDNIIEAISHNNSISRWQRVVAYTLRFILNCRSKGERTANRQLSAEELDNAMKVIIKAVQYNIFTDEIAQINQDGQVHIRSPLSTLAPFIDDQGLIRVGGRLEAADIPYNTKHPIVLPYAHDLTRMMMSHIHITNLHCGPQSLLAITRQKYWPIKGKTVARSIVGRCIRCAKARPKVMNQFISNLPASRVQPSRPFANSGVDFLGPIWIHYKLRGKRPQKAYVAVFCCFATKAVHFEVASDLSTAAFIACLKRFVGRRGHCINIYSDNATNFIGAKNQLQELTEGLYSQGAMEKISNYCTTKGITFHFIPPRAPHFGGLWEAAVKSAKRYLQRNLGSASLTYEELETLMVEIEAILNSRPLTPLSADPNDLTALTPGHFLIGEPLTTAADPTARTSGSTLAQRWKQVFHLKRQFWQRWSMEYLSELQHRYKWKQEASNARPGMMVLIKDDNLPITHWQLGRITNIIKGQDGLVRVADVRTASGTLRRPIHKLAPLPVETEDNTTNPVDQDNTRCSEKAPVPSAKRSADPVPSTSKASPSEVTRTRGLSPVPTTSKTSTSPTTSKRRRHSPMLTFLVVIGLILPSFGQIKITNLNKQPGIYYESLGNVHLISNEWSLVIHCNMSTIRQEHETIKGGISKLNQLCNLIIEKPTCEPIVHQFLDSQLQLESGNELLLHNKARGHMRPRRAPLDIVGNLASSLFGVLDSEYARQMSGIINDLQHNDRHLLDLIRNQTSIIDSTANILKKSEEHNARSLEELNQHLHELSSQANKVAQENQQQRLLQAFTTVSVRLLLAINNFQRIQSTLWDVLLDTHQGRINPYLLAPDQLNKALLHIQEQLPSSLRLPSRPDDLVKLYSLMNVEGRAEPNFMIFKLTLPLFTSEQFEMIHIVPIPFQQNNSFIKINPSSEFIIINLHRDQYYPLSENEMRSCRLSEQQFICKQLHPLYNKRSNRSACEISLFTRSSPRECQLIHTQNYHWIQLATPNKWIFTWAGQNIVNIVCKDTVTQDVLEGTGILEISPECSLRDDTITIHGHNTISTSLQGRFISTKNFTDFLNATALDNFQVQHFSTIELKQDIETLQERISALKGQEILPDAINHHDVHQYTISYTGLAIIICILAYILVKHRRSIIKRTSTNPPPPVPLPRSTSLRHLEQAQRGENV